MENSLPPLLAGCALHGGCIGGMWFEAKTGNWLKETFWKGAKPAYKLCGNAELL